MVRTLTSTHRGRQGDRQRDGRSERCERVVYLADGGAVSKRKRLMLLQLLYCAVSPRTLPGVDLSLGLSGASLPLLATLFGALSVVYIQRSCCMYYTFSHTAAVVVGCWLSDDVTSRHHHHQRHTRSQTDDQLAKFTAREQNTKLTKSWIPLSMRLLCTHLIRWETITGVRKENFISKYCISSNSFVNSYTLD